MIRDDVIARFLDRQGWGAAECRVLAEDASFRRYLRLSGIRRGVLMDAPPGREDVRPFLHIQAHLEALGLSVPAVLATDVADGLVLLEDLGDALFPTVLAEDTRVPLYDAATDALAVLHAAPPPALLPAWNGAAMLRAAEATFIEWWWPVSFGAPAGEAVRAAFAEALAATLAPLGDGPLGFVHRDYFAGNLFWLPREKIRRVGIIDFQDAAIGHPAYDLVSLVEDARRDLPGDLAEREIGRYLAQRPMLDPAAFRTAYAACAAHRHLRVAALWVRLARRDGKPAYLAHSPRTWRLLEAALRAPAAAPLAAFFAQHVPAHRRGNPPC